MSAVLLLAWGQFTHCWDFNPFVRDFFGHERKQRTAAISDVFQGKIRDEGRDKRGQNKIKKEESQKGVENDEN